MELESPTKQNQKPAIMIESQMSDETSSAAAAADIGANDSRQPQKISIESTSSLSPCAITSLNSLTYYYSSFDLFENSNPAFLKYRRFINKLQIYLGPDWVIYANQVLYREGEMYPGGRIYLDNTVVFEVCLEIWLQMRREFSREIKNLNTTDAIPSSQSSQPSESQQQQQKQQQERNQTTTTTSEQTEINGGVQNPPQGQSTLQEINFSMFEENEIFEQFSLKFAQQFPDCQIDTMTYKPVIHGFFLSAVETWNYILRNPTKKRPRSDSFKHIIDEYRQKIIKPIMVVQQKLTGIFGQGTNPIKNEKSDSKEKLQQQEQSQNLNENLLRSFKNFAKNINNEEEMMVEGLKKLDINQSYTVQHAQMTSTTPPPPPPQLKKISETGDKAIVDFAQSYIKTIVNDTEKRWQVARGFVTNIIELKYNDFQMYANDIKIRFLQPAQGFYNQLMDTYILFKSNNIQNIQFQDFLEKAKLNLGSKWSESLVIPTQVFFQTLINQWNVILNEGVNTNREYDDETIIHMFVQRVRSRMAAIWDENIVKKAQENISE